MTPIRWFHEEWLRQRMKAAQHAQAHAEAVTGRRLTLCLPVGGMVERPRHNDPTWVSARWRDGVPAGAGR